jgi:Protein of unknown function (DUF2510)
MTQMQVSSSERAVRDPEVPSGWYPDPPLLRFWTGSEWSDETRPAPPTRTQRVVEPRTTAQALAAWREESPRRAPAPVVVLADFFPVPVETAPEPRVVPEPPPVTDQITPVPVALDEPGPVFEVEAAEVEDAEEPHVLRELGLFLLVAFMAIGIAGVVAAIGIALTV